MLPVDVCGDELRLLDDPVQLGMLAGERDEGGEARAFSRQPVRRVLDGLGDVAAHGLAHILD